MTGEEDGSTMAERTYEAVKSFKERNLMNYQMMQKK